MGKDRTGAVVGAYEMAHKNQTLKSVLIRGKEEYGRAIDKRRQKYSTLSLQHWHFSLLASPSWSMTLHIFYVLGKLLGCTRGQERPILPSLWHEVFMARCNSWPTAVNLNQSVGNERYRIQRGQCTKREDKERRRENNKDVGGERRVWTEKSRA